MSVLISPVARPQSIAEVLDAAIRVFQRTLVRSLPFAILNILLGQAANIYLLVGTQRSGIPGTKDPAWWGIFVVSQLLGVCVWYAMLSRQCAFIAGEQSSFAGALRKTAARFPQILLLVVLEILSIAAGIIALVIPALYLFVPLALAWPALALEPHGAVDAYKAGLRLCSGHWWRVTTALSVALIVAAVFYLVGVMIIGVVLQLGRSGDPELIYAPATMMMLALSALVAPLYTALLIAIYFDLKARDAQRRETAGAKGAAAPNTLPPNEAPAA